MTREEIDIMWQQALQDSVRDGEMFTRYHFAKMIADKQREASAEMIEDMTDEQWSCLTQSEGADAVRVGGALWTS